MKQNKRFILLVVMVLLANCLFAGLASAVTYQPTISGLYAPQKAIYTYNRMYVDAYDTFYTSPAAPIWMNIEWARYASAGQYVASADHDNDFITVFYTDNWLNVEEMGGYAWDWTVTSLNPDVVTVNKTTWGEIYLSPKKLGTATIRVQANLMQIIQRDESGNIIKGKSIASGYSTEFTLELKRDVAGEVTLSKKPTDKAYVVGDSITIGYAGSNVTTTALKYYYDLYGNYDAVAFITYRDLDYVMNPSYSFVSIPSEWKVSDVQTGPTTEYDFQDRKTGTWYTPSKYKQVSLSEYDWSGIVTYRFTDIAWKYDATMVDAEITATSAKFTFKKQGTVEIYAYMKGDENVKSNKLTWTVGFNPEKPEDSSLKLYNADGKTSATVKLIKGKDAATIALTAKDAAGKAVDIVKFVSGDKKVATVDEKGVVTIGTGFSIPEVTTKITGYDKNGNAYTFNLKVKKVPVSKLTVAKKSLTLKVGETAQIEVTTKPAYAYNPAVKYTSGDKKIATVDAEGVVTAKKVGTTTVTVTPKFAKETVNPVVVKVKVK
jgi:uncharacterized protein YjdB